MSSPGFDAVRLDPAAPDDRDRHARAVADLDPLAGLDVVGRVEAPEDRLPLELGATPRGEVDVEHGARRRPRLDDHLDAVLAGLGVVAEPDRVDRLVDDDVPRRAVAGHRGDVTGQHPQRREAAGPQREHAGGVEGVDADEALALARGEQRDPLLVARGVEGRPGEVGVGAVGVVDHEESVGGRLDVVLDPVAPGRDDAPLPLRVVRGQHPDLRGRLGAQPEEQPALVPAAADPHPEPLVVLLVDEDVLLRVPADAVPPQLVGAPRVVEPGVEDERPVAAELAAVADTGERGVEDLTARDVAHGEGEALVAGGVDRERDEPVVRADGQRTEREELGVPGLEVAVEDDLLPGDEGALGVRAGIALGPGRPHVGRVLPSLGGPAEVPPRAARHRDRQVVLLHPGADLVEQRTAQVRQVRRALLGVRVLGRQVGEELGVLEVLHPGVRVLDALPVVLADVRSLRGGGWGGARHAATLCGGHDAARAAPRWGAALVGAGPVRDRRRGRPEP